MFSCSIRASAALTPANGSMYFCVSKDLRNWGGRLGSVPAAIGRPSDIPPKPPEVGGVTFGGVSVLVVVVVVVVAGVSAVRVVTESVTKLVAVTSS